MFEVTNEILLEQVVEQAITDAYRNCRKEWRRDAWVASIVEAAAFLRTGDLSMLDYRAGRMTIATDAGEVTVTLESCECLAANAGRPCSHRAMVRLLARYAEREDSIDVVMPQGYNAPELLECGTNGCGWRGTTRELVYNTESAEYPPLCPKCEGEDLGELPTYRPQTGVTKIYAYAAGGSR